MPRKSYKPEEIVAKLRQVCRSRTPARCFLAIPRLTCYTLAVRKLSCSPKPCRSQGFSLAGNHLAAAGGE
jgi:hypothetical protein